MNIKYDKFLNELTHLVDKYGLSSRRKQKYITPLPPDDPCQFMLHDDITSQPTFHRKGCYICEDPEFAQMGLPLCYPCRFCKGHVAADDTVCDDCQKEQEEEYE